MTIIVEAREPLQYLSIGDKVESFQYGDYIIEAGGKRIIIERKTLNSYWTDLKTGRLHDQLIGCDALVIQTDGFFVNNDNLIDSINGISRHHIVWFVHDKEHLEKTLRRYEMQLENGTFGAYRQFVHKEDLPVALRILSQFDGVGLDRATSLLKTFKNLSEIFEMCTFKIEDTEGLPEGVGPKTMENIQNNLYDNPLYEEEK
jgi:ERCC4-type nuclease